MKILLIKPKSTVFYNIAVPPLGLQYLSAVLKQAGYRDVKIVHMDVQKLEMEDIKKEIREYNPDVIGLSVIISEAVHMVTVADIAKRINPDSLVVVGGPYPSACPEQCLNNASIDIVVRGEGELTFLDIVKSREAGYSYKGIDGIVYNDGGIRHNQQREFYQNIDDLPLPDYEGINIDLYKEFIPQTPLLFKQKHVRVITSRGCPYKCGFCYPTMGRSYRHHSAKRVVNEIFALCEKYNTKNVEIIDDVFNFDRDRALAIMNMIADADKGIKIYFPSGLRGDLLDRVMIDVFKKAGVVYMPVGIETANQQKQKEIGKNVDLAKLKDNVKYGTSKRIFINGYFILGLPGEKVIDILRTIWFACISPLHSASFFILHCYEGSDFSKRFDEKKIIKPHNAVSTFFSSARFINASSINDFTLIFLLQLANFIFYFNPVRAFRILRDMPDRKCFFFLIRRFVERMITS